MNGADSLIAGMGDEDAADPGLIAAQDKLLQMEENNRFITEFLIDIIDGAQAQAKAQMRARQAMAETELRKRNLEERRQMQDLAMNEDRMDSLAKAKQQVCVLCGAG